MAIRETPGQAGSYDLVFQLGSQFKSKPLKRKPLKETSQKQKQSKNRPPMTRNPPMTKRSWKPSRLKSNP